MATEEQLIGALRQADAAGDHVAAQRFADMIKSQRKPSLITEAARNEPQSRVQTDNPMATEKRGTAPTLAESGTAFAEGAGQGAFDIPGNVLGEDYRAARAARAEKDPLAAGAGYVAGAAGSGGAATKVLTKVAPVLAPVAGQSVRNVARMVTTGAVTGGAQAGAEGQDVLTGAALGGVAGPLAVGAVKGAIGATRAVGGALSRRVAGNNAIRSLAKRLGETPDALQTAVDDFRAATGRAPTLVEVLQAGSAEELGKVANARSAAGDVFRGAQADVSAARPATMRTRIEAGGPTDTVANADKVRKEAFDAAMGPIAAKRVKLPTDIPSAVRRQIANDVKLRAANGDKTIEAAYAAGEVDIRTLDNVRQNLGKLDQSQPGLGYGKMRDLVTKFGATAEPTYGHALDEYGAFSRRLAGLKDGSKGKLPADLEGPARADAGTPDYAAGRNVGVRTRLADAAGDSEAGALATAKDVQQGGTATEMRGALNPRETNNIQALGQAELTGAERLAQTVPAQKAASDEFAKTGTRFVESIVALGGHALTGFKAHVLSRLLLQPGLSPATARRIAEYATNPSEVPNVIAALRRARLNEQQIREILMPVAGAGGATAGGAQ